MVVKIDWLMELEVMFAKLCAIDVWNGSIAEEVM